MKLNFLQAHFKEVMTTFFFGREYLFVRLSDLEQNFQKKRIFTLSNYALKINYLAFSVSFARGKLEVSRQRY